VAEETGLPQVSDILTTFVYVVRLGEQTPSHPALRLTPVLISECPPLHPHPGDGLAVDAETHGSSR